MSEETTGSQEERQIPVVGEVPDYEPIVDWVNRVAGITQPDAIQYMNGSDEEYQQMLDLLVASGTAVRLNDAKKPNSIYCRSDPGDVARVEKSTFICSEKEEDAGPTNNWIHPRDMKRTMLPLFEGSMVGRTMYVIPFCMGSLDATDPKFGIEVTDSAYVVASMRIMTTMGSAVVDEMIKRQADYVHCLHSVGMPLPPGTKDVPWPCNETKYISHFPDTREVWSYGSGYGGNALLGKKCYALRIASVMARDEGWLAEHMLILKLTSPEGKTYNICAAFPSACGKTNMAMLQPTLPGWKAETLGDDIAWLRFGEDGRLYAVNPEAGFFGVAPGTSLQTNPNAMATAEAGNSIFTNVALTDDGDVWWEGMTKTAPKHLTDWLGRSWDPVNGPEGGRPNEKSAHPNSRFCSPIDQCPILADEYYNPDGVPIDIIIFGGRRQNTIPLVNEARDWNHGVFMGATCSSETTAAAVGTVGLVRRDPMAMLPFIGYSANDYFRHWYKIGEQAEADKLPKIFYVNWFRKDADDNFMWPGFGDNVRVLKWMIDRLEGKVEAIETPIGLLPHPEDIDVSGLSIGEQELWEVVSYRDHEWVDELPRIDAWLDFLGDEEIPPKLREELDELEKKVGHMEPEDLPPAAEVDDPLSRKV